MNLEQAKGIIDQMSRTWVGERSEDQLAEWYDTLAPLNPAQASEAVRNLKFVKTFWPSHAEFFEAVESVVHRQAQREQAELAAAPVVVPAAVKSSRTEELRRIRADGAARLAERRREQLAKWGPGMFAGRPVGGRQ